MKKIVLAIFLLALSLTAGTARNNRPVSSFAIIIDHASYNACKAEVDAYKAILDAEGLPTIIVAGNWQTPDQVKARILKLYNSKPRLEGIVLVGEIPVARVLGAQHFTTAFKMNQNRFPWNECSVPSDRFYDCFDLKFKYIKQDSLEPSWHYYWLSEEGTQRLQPTIYSARMKVPNDLCGGDNAQRFELLRGYLQKVVAAHKETNPFDRLVHFSGHGYNSDCLTAWRQYALVFGEYFPQAFASASGNTFLNFQQDPVIKYLLYDQIQRPGTDLLAFYEHGAPDTQYINGDYPAHNFKEHIGWLKHLLRVQYKRYIKPEDQQEFIKMNCDMYHLDPAMFHPDTLATYAMKDSTDAADRNIVLADLNKLKPGARVVMFNACYNGSFHEEGYVAGSYLFVPGSLTVTAQGNTVNVLQDKVADQLIGYIGMGIRLGFWQKEVITLESHMLGDPTFRFTACEKADEWNRALAAGAPEGYWRGYLQAPEPMQRAMALKQLTGMGCMTSAGLEDIFVHDPSFIVRMQALLLSSSFADEHTKAIIMRGFSDPYENIRRQACHMAGKMGCNDFIKPLKSLQAGAYETQRVQYAAQTALKVFDPALVGGGAELANPILDEAGIRYLRNNPQHFRIPELLGFLADAAQPADLRVVMAEALGWFNNSAQRMQIAAVLEEQLRQKGLPEALRTEMVKTVKRLKNN
ncbi:MAG: HEAT repeat domain-containing protein [Bacteroidales bacterium]|jgi:hypothetical protein|nr:HEAT repeat domain-containing protein [Bacteroidales bacterium]MDD3209425.1 HEAT repeat domain-containing protein [Bacteroidales bacterium]MDD5517518.1 HEAT repeat domain-containing protein [Bacteroidales bacterium]MDY0353290.1 HEAT repeat domain-containing protein [Bacteroidales bacterium]HHV04436.1 HEAT repeat domain-containing protein [Bacteroidales bacterium]